MNDIYRITVHLLEDKQRHASIHLLEHQHHLCSQKRQKSQEQINAVTLMILDQKHYQHYPSMVNIFLDIAVTKPTMLKPLI